MNQRFINHRTEQFQEALFQKRACKVISGIANFDLDNVLAVVRAAEIAGASAVDVAARPDILEAVRKETNLTVFASCIQPKNLALAAEHGADVVEIGNYDALYANGLFFTHDEVLKLAAETVKLVGGNALVSVTIPGHLSLETQGRMAEALEALGVDMIQTEGASRALSAIPQIKELSAAEKALLTFNNARHLAARTRLPIIAASGITADNVLTAFEYGASSVGIGSAVNKLETEADMIQTLRTVMSAIQEHTLAPAHTTADAAKTFCQVS